MKKSPVIKQFAWFLRVCKCVKQLMNYSTLYILGRYTYFNKPLKCDFHTILHDFIPSCFY